MKSPRSPIDRPELDLPENEQDGSIRQVMEIYGIEAWSEGYFGIAPNGAFSVRIAESDRNPPLELSFPALLRELHALDDLVDDGPVLVRFPQILQDRVHRLYQSFQTAIKNTGYQGGYQGVTPMKVNQDRSVMASILDAGASQHHGLEVGTKAELMAAASLLRDEEALLVCNGRKDAEYLRLTSLTKEAGLTVVVVIESLQEAKLVAALFPQFRFRPQLGIRLRLRTRVGGSWGDSSGSGSPFGLPLRHISEVIRLLDEAGLREEITMVHCHQASQIPSLASVRESVQEAARVYVALQTDFSLPNLSLLNVGGGLGVELGLPMSDDLNGRDYEIDDYCLTVVSEIDEILHGSPNLVPPVIVSESGRALVSHATAFLFPILEVVSGRAALGPQEREKPPTTALALSLMELTEELKPENAVRLRRQADTIMTRAHDAFLRGELRIQELQDVEHILADFLFHFEQQKAAQDSLPLASAEEPDCCYSNFNLFYSVPDLWGLGHVFPIVPLQRLHETPNRSAVLKDLTCDSYGAVREFGHPSGRRSSLPIHSVSPGETYHLGAFLVGAYQEPLAARHNLLGRPNLVEVHLTQDGPQFNRVQPGETIRDVIAACGYAEGEWRQGLEELLQSNPSLGSARRSELLSEYSRASTQTTYLS